MTIWSRTAVYILVANAAEETIYIGEADPVGDRLKNHVSNKEGWLAQREALVAGSC